jgi:hypothetical protein
MAAVLQRLRFFALQHADLHQPPVPVGAGPAQLRLILTTALACAAVGLCGGKRAGLAAVLQATPPQANLLPDTWYFTVVLEFLQRTGGPSPAEWLSIEPEIVSALSGLLFSPDPFSRPGRVSLI